MLRHTHANVIFYHCVYMHMFFNVGDEKAYVCEGYSTLLSISLLPKAVWMT